MGLPTRLHGDAVAEFFGDVKGICPRCNSMRKWKIIKEDDKFYKICAVCGLKVEVKDPEFSKLLTAENDRRTQKRVIIGTKFLMMKLANLLYPQTSISKVKKRREVEKSVSLKRLKVIN
jgi:hypothetical protein